MLPSDFVRFQMFLIAKRLDGFRKLCHVICWNLSLKILAKRKKSDQPMHNYSRHHFVCLSMQNKLQLHLISQAEYQKLLIVSKIVSIMFDISGLQGLDNLGTVVHK